MEDSKIVDLAVDEVFGKDKNKETIYKIPGNLSIKPGDHVKFRDNSVYFVSKKGNYVRLTERLTEKRKRLKREKNENTIT